LQIVVELSNGSVLENLPRQVGFAC
jgi:hypothetical protein